MFSGFPKLTTAEEAAPIDLDFEMEDEKGCVRATELEELKEVRITYPGLCAMLHASKPTTSSHVVFGNLVGLQLKDTLIVSDIYVRATPHSDEDQHISEEERHEREMRERELIAADAKVFESMYEEEMLDTYKVGQFVSCSARFNPYSSKTLNMLANAHRDGSPAALLVFDPLRTSLLGRPYLRAFALTEAFYKYLDLYTKEKGPMRRRNIPKYCKEAGLTKAGVLREIPVHMEVDAFHKLGLLKLEVHPVKDSFQSVQSGAVANYMEALMSSIRGNVEQLKSTLDYESNMKDNMNMPLAQNPETLLLLKHVREQTEHLSALCDSTLMSSSMVQEI